MHIGGYNLKTVFINLTPKKKNSMSGYLLRTTKLFIKGECVTINYRGGADDKKILCELENAQNLVFVTPLYVDGLPSHVLELLQRLEKTVSKELNVYALLNCGFYEGEQCELALNMIKIWCKHSGTNFCGGLGLGAGEMHRVLRWNIPISAISAVLGALALAFNFHTLGVSLLWNAFGFIFFWFIFSFNMFLSAQKTASNISKSKNNGLCYTTVSFCPSWLFTILASGYWILRAFFFHGIPFWKIFKRYNLK